jgi:hypothetical protein
LRLRLTTPSAASMSRMSEPRPPRTSPARAVLVAEGVVVAFQVDHVGPAQRAIDGVGAVAGGDDVGAAVEGNTSAAEPVVMVPPAARRWR